MGRWHSNCCTIRCKMDTLRDALAVAVPLFAGFFGGQFARQIKTKGAMAIGMVVVTLILGFVPPWFIDPSIGTSEYVFWPVAYLVGFIVEFRRK
ncbi:MAG: hypothetical protein UZ18_ATM001001283 [Armatimonadetes bacterium OLB18]|nr:MAG: hypothetical protein UZ18_ATM001001283 [Armatimonadetes bacterium OLB18]MBV6490498.1 hypothetical protein [Fimbriimonadaceae bacterium]